MSCMNLVKRIKSLSEVKGNLKRNVEFWYSIGTPQFILSVIRDGYCLVFDHPPPSVSLKNNKSAVRLNDFVDDAVVETARPPYIVNPLSVSVQSNSRKRLILNLRHVNKYLKKQKDAYMVSFDLKAVTTMLISIQNTSTFWGLVGYSVLLFGLSTALHIFTKILKPLEKHWRIQGLKCLYFRTTVYSWNKTKMHVV